MTEFHI